MAQIEQQLFNIESQLKKYAEQLGNLNIANNKYLESNEVLETEIIALKNKINKKKHLIEQQNKDKQIIHQKLVKAEKIKEEIELKWTSQKAKKQQQQRVKQDEERIKKQKQFARQQQKKRQQQLQQQAKRKIQQAKAIQKKIVEDKKHQEPVREFTPIQPKLELKNEIIQEKKEIKIEVPQKIPVNSYDNAEKGQYQPPALFEDVDDESDEDDDEDNSKTLQILRSKLRMSQKQLHEDDDDD